MMTTVLKIQPLTEDQICSWGLELDITVTFLANGFGRVGETSNIFSGMFPTAKIYHVWGFAEIGREVGFGYNFFNTCEILHI